MFSSSLIGAAITIWSLDAIFFALVLQWRGWPQWFRRLSLGCLSLSTAVVLLLGVLWLWGLWLVAAGH